MDFRLGGTAGIVEIPDADLRSFIEETLGKAGRVRITEERATDAVEKLS